MEMSGEIHALLPNLADDVWIRGIERSLIIGGSATIIFSHFSLQQRKV